MSESEIIWPLPEGLGLDGIELDCSSMQIEDYLTYRLGVLSGEFARNITRYLNQKFDLSLAESRIIMRLSECGSLSYGGLCERIHVDGALISRAAAALVERRIVSKTPDPKDARRATFELTKTGDILAEKVRDVGRKRQLALLERLTPEERRVMYETISKLMKHISGLNREGEFLGDETAN